MNAWVEILIIFGLIILNGLLAMAELAVVSARKGRLERQATAGSRRAQVALELSKTPTIFLATVQIGISLIGIAAGVFCGVTLSEDLAVEIARLETLAPYAQALSFLIVVSVITFISLVIGELVPKRLALVWPEKLASVLAPPLQKIATVLAPLVRLLDWSTEALLNFFAVPKPKHEDLTEDDMHDMLERGTLTGAIDETEAFIAGRAFRLGDRPIATLMTRRADIVWLDIERPFDENWEKAVEAAHGLFPLAKGQIDNIIGIVHLSDIAACKAGKLSWPPTQRLIEPLRVVKTASALKVLEQIKSRKVAVALVIDEHSGVSGLVTAHDLLEAMVGELESDNSEPVMRKREDGSLIVDASIDAKEIFEEIGIEMMPSLRDGLYHSLGGFVFSQLGKLPNEGDSFTHEGFKFEVIDMDGRRVDKVLIQNLG